MKRLGVLILLFMRESVAQQMSTGSIKQTATCAVAGIQGNVSVTCSSGVPASFVKLLNKQFAAQLKERDTRNADLTAEVNEWKDRFDRLLGQIAGSGMDNGLKRQANDLLKKGDLEAAGRILDKVLENSDKEVEDIADAHFNRASLFELQFEP